MSAKQVDIQRLAQFAEAILIAAGVQGDDAQVCASRLVEGDARGQHAHGLARLPAYVRRIEEGGLNPRAVPHVERETLVTALVDGENGLGPVVMTYATRLAITKARDQGLAWIGVRRSNHAGASGVYVQLVADEGLIGIYAAVANSNQMAPWGGTDRLLGTNPLAIAIPLGKEPSVVLDMATTTASFARIRQSIAAGESLAPDWLIDRSGQPVTDPALVGDATLTPIGGYKGYGLSLMIALLAGALNGASIGSNLVDHYIDWTTPTNTGHLLIALEPTLLRPEDEFHREVSARLAEIRTSNRMPGFERVQVPGDRSAEQRSRAAEQGAEMSSSLLDELRVLADRLHVPYTLAD